MMSIPKTQRLSHKPSATYQALVSQLITLLSEFNKSLDPRILETTLQEAMWYVNFVGELPIERYMFEVMATWLQYRHVLVENSKRKVLIDRVYPATLVTSMVFSARYSSDEKRQFWDSYCQQVWGTEYSQSLASQGRECFRRAVGKLEKMTRMDFPILPGFVVDYHVNRHALLPAYLQDDVANWLKKHLQTLIQTEFQQAVVNLLNNPDTQYLAPRVKAFLFDETTSDLAIGLLEQMTVAIQRFHDGEPANSIADLLLNPIERSLWSEIAETLKEQATTRRSVRRADIQWVWALDKDDWQLRIRNFFSDLRPIEAVWRSSEKSVIDNDIIADIEPWRREDGLWKVDELLMTDGAIKGEVSLYAAQNKKLLALATPPMPSGDFIIYRPTQQMQFAIPVDHRLGLSNGQWLITSEDKIEVRDVNNRIAAPIQSDFYVPQVLREVTKHKRAALYRIDFPAKILINGELFSIPRRTDSIGQPWLTGKHPIQLTSSVPPAFSDNQIVLHLPDRPDDLTRLSLVIQTEQFSRRWDIDELTSSLQESEDGCQLDLSLLLPCQIGVFTIDIQRGLRSALPAPLLCTLLPQISIIPPDNTRIFWRDELPNVWISGINRDQIGDDHLKIISEGKGWRVTWDDLRQSEYRLPLNIGVQQITLAWKLKRHYAYLDKLESDQTIPLENLPSATLTIYGSPGESVILNVNGTKYTDQIKDNSRGSDHLALRLLRHRLFDLIRGQSGERIPLSIQIGEHMWQIGTILRETSVKPVVPKQQLSTYQPEIQIYSETEKTFAQQLTERLNAIHQSDTWIAKYGLLPAWAVTGNVFLFCYTRGNNTYRLPIVPEVLSHRGTTGFGHILLKLDGFRFERNYASWDHVREGLNLRIKIPLQEPSYESSMEQLTQDDLDEMWCAYQCRYCGEIVGNRLSSQTTYRQQQVHSHGRSEGAQFTDLFYGQPLRGEIIIEKWNVIEKPVVPYELYFNPDWASICKNLPEYSEIVNAPKHPLGLEMYKFATLRHVLRRSQNIDDYDVLLDHNTLIQIKEKIRSYIRHRPIPMLSTAVRFLDALSPDRNFDTQIISLAILKRLQDIRDPATQELEAQIGSDKKQIQYFMEIAMRVCPELLLWAFTWVELFYVHAIG